MVFSSKSWKVETLEEMSLEEGVRDNDYCGYVCTLMILDLSLFLCSFLILSWLSGYILLLMSRSTLLLTSFN